MMAIIGDSSIKKSDLLLKFRCLSACGNVRSGAPFGQDDGWGILSYKDNSPEYLGKSTEPAWKNGEYGSLLSQTWNCDARHTDKVIVKEIPIPSEKAMLVKLSMSLNESYELTGTTVTVGLHEVKAVFRFPEHNLVAGKPLGLLTVGR